MIEPRDIGGVGCLREGIRISRKSVPAFERRIHIPHQRRPHADPFVENRRLQPLEDQIALPFPLYRIGDGVDKLDTFFLAAFQKLVPERTPMLSDAVARS
jgi:hypothetical protein